MSQPETAIELGSDTESEDGLRDHLAAASRSADDNGDEQLHTPTPLAASSLPDRSGTPVTCARMTVTAQTKRKAAAALLMPTLNDEDNSDGAATSTPPRGPPAEPISSP